MHEFSHFSNTPMHQRLTVSSSKRSSLSTRTNESPNNTKPIHAIAKMVSPAESRLETWRRESQFEKPYVPGQNGGKRIWDVFDKLNAFDDKYHGKGTDPRK
jgi:hypothetical protein